MELHEVCCFSDEVEVPAAASGNQPCDNRMEIAAPVRIVILFVNA